MGDKTNRFQYCLKCGEIARELEIGDHFEFDSLKTGEHIDIPLHNGCGGGIYQLNLPEDGDSKFDHAISVSDFEALTPKEQELTRAILKKEIEESRTRDSRVNKPATDYNNEIPQQHAAQVAGYTRVKCPMCGKYMVISISPGRRFFSGVFLGLGSSNIGKQYECKSCGHKF